MREMRCNASYSNLFQLFRQCGKAKKQKSKSLNTFQVQCRRGNIEKNVVQITIWRKKCGKIIDKKHTIKKIEEEN